MAQMARAGMKWVALNVADHTPDEWLVVHERARAAGVVVIPKARLGHPLLGDTREMCLARLERLCQIADEWNPAGYCIVNVETEIKPPELGGLVTPQEVAAIIGDRKAAISTEALLYAMDWGPLTKYALFLQIYPTDNRWISDPAFAADPAAFIAAVQAERVKRARGYGFTYVGTTFQAWAPAEADWYDRRGTAWSIAFGDDVGVTGWDEWAAA